MFKKARDFLEPFYFYSALMVRFRRLAKSAGVTVPALAPEPSAIISVTASH